MSEATTKSAARGTRIVVKESPPMRGEPEFDNNKAMPSKMAGSTRDLSHSISGASFPKGK